MFGNLMKEAEKFALKTFDEQITQQFGSQVGQQANGRPPHAQLAAQQPASQHIDERDKVYVQDAGDERVMLSTCNGRKKALFIGINYPGTKAELRGCWNDIKNISSFIARRFGFSMDPNSAVFLTDEPTSDANHRPTMANITNAMRWLVGEAKPGDSLFLHYSGHGGTAKDHDNEENTGFDQTILPCDFEQAGQLTDDVLHDILVKNLPAGVRLTAIFDSCHSGTVMDLPFTYKCSGEIEVICEDNRKEAAIALLGGVIAYSKGDTRGAMAKVMEGFNLFTKPPGNPEKQKRVQREKASPADLIQFAGCRDDQTSADANIGGNATGAMSHAFVKTMTDKPNQKYTELLQNLRDILRGRYSQIPQMSTGHAMDMNAVFFM